MEELTTAGLRFSTKESGAQCVMMSGISMMLTWCVVSLVSPVHHHIPIGRDMVKDLTLSGWMMSDAVEEKLRYLLALIGAGEWLAVAITKMQV